ncbi:MAG: DUF4886 domain-containing protein [Oscillospiraceae bacterium]|nr:DUF4886 domain-containing protein [Oscillospiraceae bacterium]
MQILSIGNSFSQDAQRYLNRIAKADGFQLNTFNLYIGGCSLSTHYRNMMSEERVYALEMNGESTGFNVSLKEALLNRDWDVITLQQASHKSPYYDTYQPYLNKIAEYVRGCVPGARIAVHQTWAYEQGSQRLNAELGYDNHTDMFDDLKMAYSKAARDIGADFLIPSGEVLEELVLSGIKAHRDTFHASLGVGRYALGLIWYSMLTGRDIANNLFSDFDVEVSLSDVETAKKCVLECFRKYRIAEYK